MAKRMVGANSELVAAMAELLGYERERMGNVKRVIIDLNANHVPQIYVHNFGGDHGKLVDLIKELDCREVVLHAPDARGVTHRCPPSGSGAMPCCGRSPFEVPRTDRLTVDDAAVTCGERTAEAEPTTDPRAAQIEACVGVLAKAIRDETIGHSWGQFTDLAAELVDAVHAAGREYGT